jgi:hypothetical protein
MKIIISIIIGVILFFLILQRISDRTYKPTKDEIIDRLKKVIDGSIDYSDFDELCSVKIAYDSSLENIRQKLNCILDDPKAINHPHSKIKEVDLSYEGKIMVNNLIKEMENLTSL